MCILQLKFCQSYIGAVDYLTLIFVHLQSKLTSKGSNEVEFSYCPSTQIRLRWNALSLSELENI